MTVGGLLCTLAAMMVVMSLNLGPVPGTLVVFWAALLTGVPLFLRGLSQYWRTRNY